MKAFIRIAILAAIAAIGVCIAGLAPPAVAKDVQKVMAEKISAHVANLPTSHVPQLSQPAQGASAILAAAPAAEQSK